MKERPILFSAPMVKALLDGTKTQTRRIVKPQPPRSLFHLEMLESGEWRDEEVSLGKCQYGQPGSKLWVKETFRESGNAMGADGKMPSREALQDRNGRVIYRADGEWEGPFRPSIFMPRWASRITLEIESVRVERLNDISEGDAKAEGILQNPNGTRLWKNFDYKSTDGSFIADLEPIESYRSLWESINGKGSWTLNPWVWAIAFKKT